MTGIFAKHSGLTGLARRYPVTQPPAGATLAKQTVRVGSVRYRRCVDVSIGEGPWEEIRGAQKTRLYSRRAVWLSIGEPEFGSVTLYKALYERIAPYLRPGVLCSL
jgi:hypothetical protein